ncbi:putative two-component response regulator protein [Parvularcula bermudensis HTCC2503]|uniref:Putative two-component response regulator protein n=1 Tax=Parvularcula bermudensis (strain ATCC BAA-594 / HTCC2503 / KCTC 12087) TaxID=314260 RepID=E0TGG8_PARBH|nr:response regulator transcription factor [Parvularcula bermudensis]ADM09587.1 putative two-component response regulator protein [Parvularcula bermudensis HTCC2503]
MKNPSSPRLVIIDDHELAREGLRLALVQRGFEVVAVGATAAEAIELTQTTDPDVVLLDIRLRDGPDGLAAAAGIKALNQSVAVVMLSLHDDADYVRAALKAGAKGYILKDTALDELCAELKTVLSGGVAIPQALLAAVLTPKAAAPPEYHLVERLTDREREVLRLISEGKTNKAIARELVISPATVKAHVERCLAKLGAADRTQAAVMMVRWMEAEG